MKTINELNDRQYRDTIIARVEKSEDGWQITDADGWSFWVFATHGIEPKAGDSVRFYGHGIGSVVRGLAINEQVLYYRTEAEEQQHAEEQERKRAAERVAEYQANKSDYERRIRALPKPFRNRINGFMERNPNFGPEYLKYELFCCEEAVKIGKALQTLEAIREFHDMKWSQQKGLVDIDDGHSGNTFGAATRFAYLHASGVDVALEHGALCPLVGCVDYGCPQAKKVEDDNP